ncbi:MAG: hypothetical protein V3U57_02845 [Robiginitomaculum sp.]
MKHHIMIAFGFVLTIIFIIRAAGALAEPGWGMQEVYVLGGFVFCSILLWRGIRDFREARRESKKDK